MEREGDLTSDRFAHLSDKELVEIVRKASETETDLQEGLDALRELKRRNKKWRDKLGEVIAERYSLT